MNAPDREECFVLDDNEVKMVADKDPKILNAVNFTIVKEDHTVGNLLRMQLLRYPDVRFAGYKIPHPLEYLLLMKVQTGGQEIDDKNFREPIQAMKDATEDRIVEIEHMEDQFKQALDTFNHSGNGPVDYDDQL